jgi:hypothetical protein
MTGNFSIGTEGEKEKLGNMRAGINANYGESKKDGESTKNVKNLKAGFNVKKTFSPMFFAALDASYLYDGIAKTDYRIPVSPACGAYMIKKDYSSLYMEAGPSYVWEKLDGLKNDYFALRLAGRFDYKLIETAKTWESIEYICPADDLGDYLLNAEAGCEAALSTMMSLRAVLNYKGDSTPAPGKKKRDTALIGRLGINF